MKMVGYVHCALAFEVTTKYSQEPNDLSFSVGDIIDILKEDNEDWWTGRGMFLYQAWSKE